VALSRSDLPAIFGRQGFWDEFNAAFAEEFRIGKGVRVLHVVPDSPASRGGLRPGDILLSLRGRAISSREQLEKAQRRKDAGAVEVLVNRDGAEIRLFLHHVRECWYGTSILVADYVNAFADGRTILVTTGMLRFSRNDDELAVVLGHELAHNVLGHSVRSYKRFEKEADYLGCYFAARAGYDVSRGVEFWRRLARESPGAISESASYAHSGTAARASALREAVEEISEKVRAKKPLVPNLTD
jgi:membrane-associated protease RseP (regulator of RpoE activity)